MGGRGGFGLAIAAGMIAMASAALPTPISSAMPRSRSRGTRVDPPMQERRRKSDSLSKLLRKGRKGGRV